MQQSIHTCTSPPGSAKGYYSSCDTSGCYTKSTDKNINLMGPDAKYVIDTRKPFQISHTHHQTNGVLDRITIQVDQGVGRTYKYDMCGQAAYIKAFQANMNSMAFLATIWGGTGTTWLDGATKCNEICNPQLSSMTLTNFAISNAP